MARGPVGMEARVVSPAPASSFGQAMPFGATLSCGAAHMPMTDIQAALSGRDGGAFVSLFCDMVRIDSESGNEEQFIRFVAGVAQRGLGATCIRDSFGNLVCRVPAKGSTGRPSVLLSAHADTVCPGRGVCPVVRNGVVSTSGQTVLGADDKAGVLEILAAVAQVERHPDVEILITRGEEKGLMGSRNIGEGILKSAIGFVVDLQALDAVVVGGPRHYYLDITVSGRAAHAGVRPEEGISAIKAASLAIAGLPDGRVDPTTTWNVGTIEGGCARNVVADSVRIAAECRSLEDRRADELADLIQSSFEQAAAAVGASVRVVSELQYVAYHIPEDALPVLVARTALEAGGIAPRVIETTGATDAVFLNARGVESVAIGFGGQNAHTSEEAIAVNDMLTAIGTLCRILEELA